MSFDALHPGAEVAGLHLVERIGEGSFGEVWKAEDLTADRRVVAAKFPRDQNLLGILRREAAALANLTHPSIVRLIRADLDHDPPCLVMEYVSGGTLRQALAERRSFPQQEAIRLIMHALGGLAAAHDVGIVHGDVKPENILLDASAPPPRARLVDFAAGRSGEEYSKSVRHSVLLADSAKAGEVGTLRYMSPERLEGGPATPSSDLYSMGVVLFELITGHASPLRFPVEGASEEVSFIIEHATGTGSLGRFHSAKDMLQSLRLVADFRVAVPTIAERTSRGIGEPVLVPPEPKRSFRGPVWPVIWVCIMAIGAILKGLDCGSPRYSSYSSSGTPVPMSPPSKEIQDILEGGKKQTLDVSVPLQDGTGQELRLRATVTLADGESNWREPSRADLAKRTCAKVLATYGRQELATEANQHRLESDLVQALNGLNAGFRVSKVRIDDLGVGNRLK